jgi:hypothetical protein
MRLHDDDKNAYTTALWLTRLDDLSFWQYHEAFAALGASDNLQVQLAMARPRWHPRFQLSCIGPSGPNPTQTGKLVAQKAQQALGPIPVLEPRGSD